MRSARALSLNGVPLSSGTAMAPCPSTQVCAMAPRVLRSRLTPTPTVAFRFKGQGTGPFWFRCKLDSRPATICKNPRKARVGVGNHTFRVRAFGPGGGATSQVVYKFKVERAKPKPKPKPKPKAHSHKSAR